MKIAIAGGTGTVGAHTVRCAEAAGHEVLVLARSRGVDLVTGSGLDLAGIDAVIDVSGLSTTSAAKSRGFFAEVTEQLLRAEREAGVGHHVALSIVGAGKSPYGYYAGKALQEELIAAAEVPWSVLRATQFFEFAQQNSLSFGRVTMLPAMRSRPLAAAAVGAELVRAAESRAAGILPDLAGPAEMQMAEVLRARAAARGERRRIFSLPLPGKFGRALQDGTILPAADAKLVGPTLAEWLSDSSTVQP